MKSVNKNSKVFPLSSGNHLPVSRKILTVLSVAVPGIAASGILMVSVMAFTDPQAVMNLVEVKLETNDAYSSIRGAYGGAGLTFVIVLIYLCFLNQKQGLALTSLLSGLYAASRVTTMFTEGSLGSFGYRWMIIEGTLSVLALLLLLVRIRTDK